MTASRLIVLSAATLLLGGCSLLDSGWFGRESGGVERSRMERLVADDFAKVLAQLSPTAPDQGPLSMGQPESAFGTALLLALRGAGYSLDFSDNVDADAYVGYHVESMETQFGTSLGYRVVANKMTLSRDYKMKASGVFPISFMRVDGAVSDSVVLDDERFQRQNIDELVITGITHDETLTTPISTSDDVVSELPVIMLQDADGGELVDKNATARINMYQSRQSNFAEFLGTLESVDTAVLTFPNDSLRVLPESRARLHELHSQFNPDTDVYSVIGCSHGNTALSNGNELLAIGRSKRVLEELISLGVPDEKVLDEGCWAGVYFDKFPRRGVVVEIKRRGQS